MMHIDRLLKAYYTDYYRDQLGLPDWKRHVKWRLSEEDVILPRIQDVQTWFNESLTPGKTILVVGGGTGAEFITFSKLGCNVYAIEPNPQAVEIGRLKAAWMGFNPEKFMQGQGEALPFANLSFDLVWCFTVLEHVQDVQMCISEMIRVTKPLGRIFIVTPDYRQFYEPHYKIVLPLFAPRWFLRLWLRVLRRPPEFLGTLQFVNSRQLMRIFQNHPVIAFQVIHSWSANCHHNLTFQRRLIKWMAQNFGIQREQYWLLQKLEKPR